MSVYKYVTAEGGLRLLRTLELRITPPAEFNDPFELRSPVGSMVTEEYMDSKILDGAPEAALAEVATRLTPLFGSVLSQSEIGELASSFVTPLSSRAQQRLASKISRGIPQFSGAQLMKIQASGRAAFPTLLRQARAAMAAQIPTLNEALRRSFSEKLPPKLGVLCLSRSANQALMWAHYADSHKGILIEFDDTHSTFNRRRSDQDEFGFLRPVSYANIRPELNMQAVESDEIFEVFALTKADQWRYEEEVRLIWPLDAADRTISTPAGAVSLLSCPASAVRSVTLGCKASDNTLATVRDLVRSRPEMAHISIRKARLHDIAFELIYDEVSTPPHGPHTNTALPAQEQPTR
jgi:hypothetical protein